MGLYISKGITGLHGGKVGVHYAGSGQGSCFKVLLPTSSASVKASLLPRKSAAQVSPLNDAINENCDDDKTSRKRVQSSARDHGTRIRESIGSSIGVYGDL